MGQVPIYFLHDNMDVIFDEKGNTFSSIRKVQWANQGDEKDSSKAKLEIRKWTIGSDGSERPLKGYTFSTEEGPDKLVGALVENGYGDTKEILTALKSREDFRDVVEHLNDEDDLDNGDGEYFDARSLLLD